MQTGLNLIGNNYYISVTVHAMWSNVTQKYPEWCVCTMNGTALCKRNNATKFGLKGLCLKINHTCVLEIMSGLIILCTMFTWKQKNSRPTQTPLILIVFSVPLSGHNITHLSNNSREHIITTNNSKPRSSLVLPTNASNRPLKNVNAITMRSSRHSIKEEVLVECLYYVSCNRKTLVQCTSWSWKLLLKTGERAKILLLSYLIEILIVVNNWLWVGHN